MPEVNEIGRTRWGQKQIWLPCIDCGQARWVRMLGGKPRNLRCLSCLAHNNPYYKGGTTYTGDGAVMVFAPDHPHANWQGKVKRARLILEERLGRYLREGHAPHHINGIKDDDRPENLEEMTQSEHAKLHALRRKQAKEVGCLR